LQPDIGADTVQPVFWLSYSRHNKYLQSGGGGGGGDSGKCLENGKACYQAAYNDFTFQLCLLLSIMVSFFSDKLAHNAD
jgi:hypothetical protein